MPPRRFPQSLPEFQQVFPNEEHCSAYLEETRWPEGFVCQYCGYRDEPFRFENRPEVLRCRNCHRDTSLTAGRSCRAVGRRSARGSGSLP
jgi:hypothetical protein